MTMTAEEAMAALVEEEAMQHRSVSDAEHERRTGLAVEAQAAIREAFRKAAAYDGMLSDEAITVTISTEGLTTPDANGNVFLPEAASAVTAQVNKSLAIADRARAAAAEWAKRDEHDMMLVEHFQDALSDIIGEE